MSAFWCCIWWFVFGLLLGWLAWWLFDKWFRRDGESLISQLRSDLDRAHAERNRSHDETVKVRAELAALRSESAAARTAAGLAGGLASAAAFGFAPQRGGRDDLTIIEGIGPKISELLLAAGIDTFAKLAATPVATVQGILDAAGPNFRLANPASWARQSDMCARADWAALRKYQDELTAGVDKKNNPS